MSVEFLGGVRTGAGGQPLPFSPAVKAGPFVFVSGQVAMGENGEIVSARIEAGDREAVAGRVELVSESRGDIRTSEPVRGGAEEHRRATVDRVGPDVHRRDAAAVAGLEIRCPPGNGEPGLDAGKR